MRITRGFRYGDNGTFALAAVHLKLASEIRKVGGELRVETNDSEGEITEET